MSTKIDKVGKHLDAFKGTTPKQVKPTEEVAEVNSSTTSEASQKLKVPSVEIVQPSARSIEAKSPLPTEHPSKEGEVSALLKVNEQIGGQKKEKIKPVPKM